jgi:osmotically-inducible protein OsmY
VRLNDEVVRSINMSNVSRLMGAFFLALLIAVPAAAQVNTIKDGWLVMKVHSEMVDEDVLSGSDIDVDVKNGVVTLQGTVPSEAARARALAVAKANDGVKNVVDQLKIAPARGSNMAAKADRAGDRAERAADRTGDKAERAAERAGDKAERAGERAAGTAASATRNTGRAIDDGWIKSKIYAQYLADWNTVLDDSNIDIDVVNNMVTLNGTVKTAEAKAKAVATAKATDGVKGVRDNLKVGGTR